MKNIFLKLVFLTVSLLISKTTVLAEDKISIGVPSFDKEVNFLTSKSLAAQVARSGLTRSLTRLKSGGYVPYSLDLADNMTVDSGFDSVSLRIARGRSFFNETLIEPKDVLYSVNRCLETGTISNISSVSLERKESKLLKGDWLKMVLEKPSPEATSDLPLQLARCPIVDAESSNLFGSKLGKNTMMVSSGDFIIGMMRAGRTFEMHRVVRQSVRRGPSVVEVRGFSEPDRALTALRLGTVDMVFIDKESTLARAREDETVLISSCFGRTAVIRKGLKLICDQVLNIESIAYTG